MSENCGCPYCSKPAAKAVETPPVHDPVVLPSEPRDFRVHSPGMAPQDCTLHADGRMTMVVAGQTLVSALSFDEMRERNWATAHIEWDPVPRAQPDPEATPAAESVQETLAL